VYLNTAANNKVNVQVQSEAFQVVTTTNFTQMPRYGGPSSFPPYLYPLLVE